MRLPSHTTAVASLALFVAMGTGGAYAASLQPGSVKSTHVANGAIRGVDVHRGAIGTKQLDEVPNGLMSRSADAKYAGGSGYIHYDRVDFGNPRSAFDPGRGAFTAPVDGSYLVVASIEWQGAGTRVGTIQMNYADTNLKSTFTGSGGQTVAGVVRLDKGDSVAVFVRLSATSNLSDSPGASLTVSFLSN